MLSHQTLNITKAFLLPSFSQISSLHKIPEWLECKILSWLVTVVHVVAGMLSSAILSCFQSTDLVRMIDSFLHQAAAETFCVWGNITLGNTFVETKGIHLWKPNKIKNNQSLYQSISIIITHTSSLSTNSSLNYIKVYKNNWSPYHYLYILIT